MASTSAEFSNFDTVGRDRHLRRIEAIARLMNTAVAIPFTGIGFDADSVLGLAPGLGDAAGAAASLIIVNEARQLWASRTRSLCRCCSTSICFADGAIAPCINRKYQRYRRRVPSRIWRQSCA